MKLQQWPHWTQEEDYILLGTGSAEEVIAELKAKGFIERTPQAIWQRRNLLRKRPKDKHRPLKVIALERERTSQRWRELDEEYVAAVKAQQAKLQEEQARLQREIDAISSRLKGESDPPSKG